MSNESKTPELSTVTPQCQFFVQRKKRLCRMTVKPGRRYCGEHEPQPTTEAGEVDKRIPCPNDPKHTCYASKLVKHLAICNARRTEQPAYIVENINAPEPVESCARRPLSAVPKEELIKLIDKINHLYAKYLENHITTEPPQPIHRAVAGEFAEPDRTESSLRHLRQTSALLWLAEREGLVRDNTCYVELGAGKGQLSYHACHAWCGAGRGRVLAVDRAPLRHKRDNRLRSRPPQPAPPPPPPPPPPLGGATQPEDDDYTANGDTSSQLHVTDMNEKTTNNASSNLKNQDDGIKNFKIRKLDTQAVIETNIRKTNGDSKMDTIVDTNNAKDLKLNNERKEPEDLLANPSNTTEDIKLHIDSNNATEDFKMQDGVKDSEDSTMKDTTDFVQEANALKDGIVKHTEESKDEARVTDVSKDDQGEAGVAKEDEPRVTDGVIKQDRDEAGVASRLRADLAHLALAAVPAVAASAGVVGLAKHLCGVATDYALRCVAAPGVLHKTHGVVLATCCHHRCERAAYVGADHLQELGIDAAEFNVMLGVVSWATCGDGRSRQRRAAAPPPPPPPAPAPRGPADPAHHPKYPISREERSAVGLKAKALLDYGRVCWLRARGLPARLARFVPPAVSPENLCIVAARD